MISTSLFKPGSFESRRGGLNLGSQFNFNLLSSPQDTQASERLLSVRAAVSGLLSRLPLTESYFTGHLKGWEFH